MDNTPFIWWQFMLQLSQIIVNVHMIQFQAIIDIKFSKVTSSVRLSPSMIDDEGSVESVQN